MQETLKRKKSLLERAADHRLALVVVVFLATGAIVAAGSGVGVSSEVANNIRAYLSALFR